ncbi:hypothetical protein RUM44_000326 [Polyplax serrata]|uniref:Uncharacterized protein n=1 Tax=Polyplax serrata TaxID=468196 RepID=A0ABR1B538_POLSC
MCSSSQAGSRSLLENKKANQKNIKKAVKIITTLTFYVNKEVETRRPGKQRGRGRGEPRAGKGRNMGKGDGREKEEETIKRKSRPLTKTNLNEEKLNDGEGGQ